jgi:hypothetical protein
MIKLRGKGIIASWRPYEEGRGGAAIRASEKECLSITVFDQTVLAQLKDGFWETMSFTNCTITWLQKPECIMVSPETGKETPVEVMGRTDTIADGMKYSRVHDDTSFKAMGESIGNDTIS